MTFGTEICNNRVTRSHHQTSEDVNFYIQNLKKCERPLYEILNKKFQSIDDIRTSNFVACLESGDYFLATYKSTRIYFQKHTLGILCNNGIDHETVRCYEGVKIEMVNIVPSSFKSMIPVKTFYDESGQVQFCFRKI